MARRSQGPRRGRNGLLALAAGVCALAFAPAGAAAADPVPGCTQTNAPADPATEESAWTCYSVPTSVAGYEVKRGGVSLPKPAISGNITQMEVDVADGSGPIPIDRLMLHHIVFYNAGPGKTDTVCGGPRERFYGAGEERMKMSLPDGYGYKLDPTDTWTASYMFMNHRAQTDKGWIKYSFTIDPDPLIRSTRFYWLDAAGCGDGSIYNVPGIEQPQLPNCGKLRKAAKRRDTKRARRKAHRCEKKAKRILAAMPTQASHTEIKDVTIEHNGFLVAGGGHVHGGAKSLTLTKPNCPGNPQIADSVPTWGNPDHPFYNVKPILHEPGPIGMSSFSAPAANPGTTPGIPVRIGQTLRLNSIYDELQPHARVMGIYGVYLVPRDGSLGDPPIDDCGGPPAGTVVEPGTEVQGRPGPIAFKVPLTGLDSNLNAIEIDGPPGPFKTLSSGATLTVGDRFFSEPNVKIRPGSTLNYAFTGNEQHNVTLANGPLGIGSPNANGGFVYSQRFDRKGTYRLFCGLHPVQMTQRVVVENPKKKKKKKKGKKR